MISRKKIETTVRLIKKQIRDFIVPSVTQVSDRKNPYLVLVSCILSLRTKDKTTIGAAGRLFAVADTPQNMIKLPALRIQKLIYPVGFYRNKSKVILGLSRRILEEYHGRVPDKLEDLLRLKGVGLKTANLVLGLGFNTPAICVDTHVHRISNRLGWINSKTAEETEEALKEIVPKRYWIALNTYFVTFGQNICVPVSPFCSRCSVRKYCKQRGVVKSR